MAKAAKDRGIKYFLISYVDLFGTMRAKLVPAAAIEEMAKSGAGFAGFASWLDMTPADPDMLAMPDPDSLIQLPWRKEVAWLAADPYMDGKLVEQAPRNVLKRVVADAAKKGYDIKTGVECEFFLIEPDGQTISDAGDHQAKPCYDQQALMRRYDVISEICDSMLELGWSPYQNDHEDANGQFEMNWAYDDALKTADRHAFFKYMVKSIAEKHGLRATFMPKPFANLTGNGCHVHVSLWAKDGKNLFDDNGDLGLVAARLQVHRRRHAFGRGAHRHHQPDGQFLQAHQRAAHAVGRHLVAEHRHLYRQQSHPHDPHSRTPAASSSGWPTAPPIHTAAGRADRRRPRRHRATSAIRASASTSTCMPRATRRRAPRSCRSICSMRCAPSRQSKVMREGLGEPFVKAYVKLKHADWNDYARHLTDWERRTTLDC